MEIKYSISTALTAFNSSVLLHEAPTVLTMEINLPKNERFKEQLLKLLLMLIANDVQNNAHNKHKGNHAKSKFIIHSTHPAYYLHHHILTHEYSKYLDCDWTK
ncbi:hypothetical protein Dimus_011446 [Dionaea muscipula]